MIMVHESCLGQCAHAMALRSISGHWWALSYIRYIMMVGCILFPIKAAAALTTFNEMLLAMIGILHTMQLQSSITG
jgi:hypothetical protein